MVFAKLFISNGSQNFKFTNLSLDGAKALTNSLNEQLNRNENTVSQNTVTSSADEIVKFKKLADDGIITQEEFEAKKKQLLDL
ncbi:SHOCT domain-containing protein [Limosilactobacillus portuensis]|nr:SHOCT domain-containing protein [Limosilactobacillus portuensis]